MPSLTRRSLLAATLALLPARALAAPQVAPLRASDVLAEAKTHVGERYVYGGTKPGSFDCSSYVSWCWRLPRLTTDTFGPYVQVIPKDDLRPGDAMNNPLPGKRGHVRIFADWANVERSKVWVYEAAEKLGVVYRQVDYDGKQYTPVRRLNVVSDVKGQFTAPVFGILRPKS